MDIAMAFPGNSFSLLACVNLQSNGHSWFSLCFIRQFVTLKIYKYAVKDKHACVLFAEGMLLFEQLNHLLLLQIHLL